MLRRLSSKLHLYLGLAAGMLLVPIGLTGGILVFHDEIDAVLYPERAHVVPDGTAASADRVVAVVAEAFPEKAIGRMELPQAADEPFEVVLRESGRQVFVDPYRGVVLGAPLPGDTITGWLFDLHVHLLGGERGKTVVGVTGLLLLVLGVTGLVLWWRGRRNLRRGLTVRWRAPARRVNYDVHNTLGFYLALPLLVVAFTGAGLVFYGAFSGAAHRLTGTQQAPPPPQSVVPSSPQPGVAAPALDTLLARAQAALPAARPARVDFPSTPEAAYRVRLRMPGEAHPIGLSMVFFDRYSGNLLHAESALAVPAARRFGYWFYPLHIGSFGGLWVRVFYALLGLTPAVLAVTGFVVWLGRRRRRGGRRTARHDRPVRGVAPAVTPAVTPGASSPSRRSSPRP